MMRTVQETVLNTDEISCLYYQSTKLSLVHKPFGGRNRYIATIDHRENAYNLRTKHDTKSVMETKKAP